ncbi:MAG: hypothetical protein ABSG43_26925, partial [Solirubrobacteraceae bacterium]
PFLADDAERLMDVGESDATGHDLLKHAVDGDAEQSAMAEAEEFLRTELATGSKLAQSVQGAARDVGISSETLKRAKRNLGVEVSKNGFQGPWKWYLNPVHQRGSSTDDHLCKSDDDHLCENPVDTGDFGGVAPKEGQANMDDHLWLQRAISEHPGPHAGRKRTRRGDAVLIGRRA